MKTKDLIELNELAQVIYDKKGSTIIAIDVRAVSSLTEYFIIAEGNVERHITAIAQSIISHQKEKGKTLYHLEGLNNSDWIVLDYGYIIIHLFHPDLREKYALESLWKEGKLVDLKIAVE